MLLILINRKTAEGLGVGFHSLNQYITGQITSSELELALITSTCVHLCLCTELGHHIKRTADKMT